MRLLRQTFENWQEDKATRLAAALAYYTVFSAAPLLIVGGVSLCTLSLNPDAG